MADPLLIALIGSSVDTSPYVQHWIAFHRRHHASTQVIHIADVSQWNKEARMAISTFRNRLHRVVLVLSEEFPVEALRKNRTFVDVCSNSNFYRISVILTTREMPEWPPIETIGIYS